VGGKELMEESAIRINQIGIGTVRLDLTAIRGEGGEYDPRLVIPIKIELHQQPLEHQIILAHLSASLHLDQYPDQRNQFASKVSYDLIYNMPMRSVIGGPSDSDLELHFHLTHAQLKALENMRHQHGKNLYLRLDPVIAWNKHTGNNHDPMPGGVSTLGEYGWDVRVGMFSDFAFFWLPAIGTLRLELAAMNWAEKIFPGVGYDSFRLVEVKLPVSDVLVPQEAVEHFKEAKQNYDRGAHSECLRKCRFVLDEIERHLSPQPQAHRLGGAITQALGWPSTPRLMEQATFLDSAWLALYSMANAAHHTPSTKSLLPADARMVLISIAAMLEYLAQLE
jgi:hypothetical protein